MGATTGAAGFCTITLGFGYLKYIISSILIISNDLTHRNNLRFHKMIIELCLLC